MFVLYFVHQNIKSEFYGIDISISQPISTKKKSKALWEKIIHTLQYGKESAALKRVVDAKHKCKRPRKIFR